jgi:hypothetical protein
LASEVIVAKTSNGTHDVHGIRVGKPRTKPEAPGHTRGTVGGNQPKRGAAPTGAARSTGIRADEHDVIDPKMPKIGPA